MTESLDDLAERVSVAERKALADFLSMSTKKSANSQEITETLKASAALAARTLRRKA